MLRITEIFKSIQGESSFAGLPCLFIRLTGCNLRCRWCDTEYAFHGGREMSIDDILRDIAPHPVRLVEITGGEPLLQEKVYSLMDALLEKGYTVLLETGGALSVARVPASVIKIMDIKCPGSGEVDQNRFENFQHLNPADEIKFVISDRKDYDWACRVLREHGLAGKAKVIFSPVYDTLNLRDLSEWVLADNLPVRVQTQLHKVIWGKDATGV